MNDSRTYPGKRNQILPKLRNLTLYLQQYEIDTIRNSRELIDCIMKHTSKTLSNLHELERAAVDMMSGRSVEKDYYERINNFSLETKNQVSIQLKNKKGY